MTSYRPSLRTALVGGVHWATTTAFLFASLFVGVSIGLESLGVSARPDPTASFVVGVLAAFVGGVLWVRRRTSSPNSARRAHARRVESLVLLVGCGFGFQVVAFGLVSNTSPGTAVAAETFVPAVANVLAAATAYVIPYALDVHPSSVARVFDSETV
ncbi:hypothetical protein AUR64_05875 [Haloprofundus marisrubri]|uniref:Uncharacterized protein n=1 Tax=Haloprofundus marisrubri TaxID=1514971 RepID=A0A0W1RBE4_9EURY|nr:hypothetical protein [Haloprofundus marisrubri]KTG10721.1 hypothetical protein AUR64_05875 [Haloprofundus marisrubri]